MLEREFLDSKKWKEIISAFLTKAEADLKKFVVPEIPSFFKVAIQKLNNIANDESLSLLKRVEGIIFLFYRWGASIEGSKGQKLILDLLTTYFALGNPSLDEYKEAIHFFIGQEKWGINKKFNRRLITDLLIIKAKQLNSFKTLGELKNFTGFLDELKKSYEFGQSEEEKKFVISVGDRVRYFSKGKVCKRLVYHPELRDFKPQLLLRQFATSRECLEFVLGLCQLQRCNQLPFASANKQWLLTLLEVTTLMGFEENPKPREIVEFMKRFEELSKEGFDPQELNSLRQTLWGLYSLWLKDFTAEDKQKIDALSEELLEKQLAEAKAKLAESLKKLKEAFQLPQDIKNKLLSMKDCSEYKRFSDEAEEIETFPHKVEKIYQREMEQIKNLELGKVTKNWSGLEHTGSLSRKSQCLLSAIYCIEEAFSLLEGWSNSWNCQVKSLAQELAQEINKLETENKARHASALARYQKEEDDLQSQRQQLEDSMLDLKTMLLRVEAYHEEITKTLSEKKWERRRAQFVLVLFDNWVFSGLQFVASLRKFVEEQDRLFAYTTQLEKIRDQTQKLLAKSLKEIQLAEVVDQKAKLVECLAYLQKTHEEEKRCEEINKEGNNLLHLAVKEENLDQVQVLLLKRANANELNRAGETALHLAVKQDHPGLMQMLIQGGARLDIATQRGKGAFDTLQGRKMFKDWVSPTTTFNVATRDKLVAQGGGEYLLYLAIEEGNTSLVKWLVENEINVNGYDPEGRTFLSQLSGKPGHFTELGDNCALDDMTSLGIKPRGAVTQEMEIANVGDKSKRRVYLEYLIEKGARYYEVQDKAGNNALHLLAKTGFDNDVIQQLVQKLMRELVAESIKGTLKKLWGARDDRSLTPSTDEVLNAQNKQGETLLHLVIETQGVGCIDLVKYLVLQKGVRLDLVNAQGKEPFETDAGTRLYNQLVGSQEDSDKSLKKKIDEQQEAKKIKRKAEAEAKADRKKRDLFKEPVSLNPLHGTKWQKKTPEILPQKPPVLKAVIFSQPPVVASFDEALKKGQYEIAKAYLKKDPGYKERASFTALPELIRQYLLTDIKILNKKGLNFSQDYVELKRELYEAVKTGNSVKVEAWFDERIKRRDALEKEAANVEIELLNCQIFEGVDLVVNWKNKEDKESKTLLEQVMERENLRRAKEQNWDKNMAREQKLKRQDDAKIIRILMEHLPKEALPESIVLEELALYDLVERVEIEAPVVDRRAEAYSTLAQMKQNLEDPTDLIGVYNRNKNKAGASDVSKEEKYDLYVMAWSGKDEWGKDMPLTRVRLDEKFAEEGKKSDKKFARQIEDLKQEFEKAAKERKHDQDKRLAEHKNDLNKQKLLQKQFVKENKRIEEQQTEQIQTLKQQSIEAGKPKVPMVVRYEDRLWFYGSAPGGKTLLEPINGQGFAKSYDTILPEKGYDLVMIQSNPIFGEEYDDFTDRVLARNEFRVSWDKDSQALEYRVTGLGGSIGTGTISGEILKQYLGNKKYGKFLSVVNKAIETNDLEKLLKPYLPKLLEITKKKGHTQEIKSLAKKDVPDELYEEISAIKGHSHGLMPDDKRLHRGADLMVQMSKWTEDQMGGKFKAEDIYLKDKEGGNTHKR